MKKIILISIIGVLLIGAAVTVLFFQNNKISEIKETKNMVRINNHEKATINGVEIEVKEIRHKKTMDGGEAGVVVLGLKDGEFNKEVILYKDIGNPGGDQVTWRRNIFTLTEVIYVDNITLEVDPVDYGKEFTLTTEDPVIFGDGLEIIFNSWLYDSNGKAKEAELSLSLGNKSAGATLDLVSKAPNKEAFFRTITLVDNPENSQLRIKVDK